MIFQRSKHTVHLVPGHAPFVKATVFTFVALFMAGCSVTSHNIRPEASEGKSLAAPTRDREVLIHRQDSLSIEPQVVEKTNDDGFVIAGGSGLTAWAMKRDAKGQTVWNYSTNLREPFLSVHFLPKFNGVAPMPDGSTYLCGWMPHPKGSDRPEALLTHINAKGQLISENLVAPSERAGMTVKSSFFYNCARWGDDVALIGRASRTIRPGSVGVLPVFENYYWILVLNAEGKVKWEKLISPSSELATALGVMHTVLLPVGADLVFSNTDNTNTEVIRLSPSGEIQARRQFSGQLRLVRPVVPDDIVELWGTSRDVPQSSMAITLNERLEEVRRIEGYPKWTFFPTVVYRMPDRSFCLFGTSTHTFGQNRRTGVAHVDRDLQSARLFEPIAWPSPYFDTGQLTAAAPLGSTGEFAVAMPIALHEIDVNHFDRRNVPQGFTRGMALDFVEVE
jgi:hypothetical protein